MLNPDKNAQGNEDIYAEAKEFLRGVIDSESDNRSRAISALKFRDGEQWDTVLLQSRPDRLNITVNHTDTMVTRIENNIKQQRPRIKAHPLGDGADIEKAQLVNGLTRDIENRSQASVAYDAGASMALSIGWGYWRIVADYLDEFSFDQELLIKPIRNPFTVYRDPGSVLPDGSDSMRYIISEKMKRIEYKQKYPKAKNVDFSPTGLGTGEWETRDEIRLAEYYRIVQKPERLFKLDSGKTMFESDFAPGEVAKLAKLSAVQLQQAGFAVEADGSIVERQSMRRQVEWYRINGTEVVDKRELPGKFIPIILCQGNVLDLNGKVRRKGMIENMIQPAKLVNYWESSKAEHLALAPKAPFIAYEGVIEGHPEWENANQRNYSVLVGKAIAGPNGELLPLPQRQPPAPASQGLSEASQDAEHQLMAIAGMPHEPGQDSQGEVVSGKAIQQRRALADDTHYQYYDNQTLSIAFTGRILFDLIPYYYDTEREQRIIGDDGVPKVVWINQKAQDEAGNPVKKNDLSIGRYDVVMDTGPGYDTKRLEGSEALTSLMDTPMGEVLVKTRPDLIMRSYDFPYADQFADSLAAQTPEALKEIMKDMPEQAKAVITAQQKQIAAQEQHIQQIEADLKYGLTKSLHQEATKLQIENMKDQRAEQDTHTDAFTKIEDTHTRAQTALAVAEIKETGAMLDTHVNAKYDTAARKDELAAAERAEAKPKPN